MEVVDNVRVNVKVCRIISIGSCVCVCVCVCVCACVHGKNVEVRCVYIHTQFVCKLVQ